MTLATVVVVCTPLSAQDQPAPARPTPARSAARPKLVVVIAVDQMRADYVDKFRQQWTGGLRRLLERGARFREAAYPYSNTFTCAGHATIGTGAFPATSGIVGNAWYDRDAGKQVTCTADPNVKAISYGAPVQGGESAWRLVVPTFADELRAQGGGGTRVVTFSIKARAAIMLAGHRADAVTWHDDKTGAWMTSSAYGSVPFIEKFAKEHAVDVDYGKTWVESLPANAYLYTESAEGTKGPAGWTAGFPHPLRGLPDSTKPDAAFYAQWEASPFSDAYLGRLAEAAVDSLRLGKGRGTDFLGISFSALDLVGHAYGPQSHEVQDILVGLDRTLAALFAHLDRAAGAQNYVVAFSADHGVAPVPEQAAAQGMDAGRLNPEAVIGVIEKALDASFGVAPRVARLSDGEVYFAPGVYSKLRDNPTALTAVLEAIRGVPGVARVLRSEEVRQRPATDDPIVRAASLSYFPGRSGDLVVVPKPYWFFGYFAKDGSSTIGTTHGVPYLYDQRVPLLLMGWGIKPGEYFAAASPAGIAPTLALLTGITLAQTDGRVLNEALSLSAATAPARAKRAASSRPAAATRPAAPAH